jgi:hypothetical protein
MDVFPIEITHQILQNLRPTIVPTPAKIDDPSVVTRSNRYRWAGQTASSDAQKSNEPLDNTPKWTTDAQIPQSRAISEDSWQDGQRTRYRDILPLRL